MTLPPSVTANQAKSLMDYYSKPFSQRLPESVVSIGKNVKGAAENLYSYATTGQFVDPQIGQNLGLNNQSAYTADSGSYGASAQKSGSGNSVIKMLKQLQADNNAWSAEQAQKQMDFQLMMSNTAHQREMADLQAAGLNPVLTATGGAGAPVASGAMAQTDTSATNAIADIAMAAISGMQNTALGVSASNGNLLSNPYIKKFLGNAAGVAGSTIAKAVLFG